MNSSRDSRKTKIALAISPGSAIGSVTVVQQRHAPRRRDPIPDHRRVFEGVAAGDLDTARAAMLDLVKMAVLDTRGALLAAPMP